MLVISTILFFIILILLPHVLQTRILHFNGLKMLIKYQVADLNTEIIEKKANNYKQ